MSEASLEMIPFNARRPCIAGPAVRLASHIAAAGGASSVATRFSMLLRGGESALLDLCCSIKWGTDELCWKRDSEADFKSYARCCFEPLQSFVSQPEPRWMASELSIDFARWAGVHITSEEMDAAEKDWGTVFCRFRVVAGRLETCDPQHVEILNSGPGSEMYGQFEGVAHVTRVLLVNGLLPDGLDFFVSPHIYEFVAPQNVPVLTKARAVFISGPVRVPSYELFGPWIDQTRRSLDLVPWEDRKPRLFWRGGLRSFNSCHCRGEISNSHRWPSHLRRFNFSRLLADEYPPGGGCEGMGIPSKLCRAPVSWPSDCRCSRHITNPDNFEWSNRIRLCELSRQNPDLIDAKLSYVPVPAYTAVRPMCARRGYLANFSHFGSQTSHRFVISTDGSTIDDTRIYWLFSSGALVFKQDLADLIDKVQWARAHDDESQAIAERGRRFADEFFTHQQTFHYVYRALMRLAALQGLHSK
eukprot:TRINITY_DN12041_c0_g1_i5.p1 TRINITY_DN12041_c0_g1~~TRINITY_DN12041_c0_g1_i5.p1  ORF type:complete len:472 (+),score=36.08 TRINITY_DN12041_c0_g1_i5:68-1483(+)